MTLTCFGVVLWVLRHVLQEYHYHDILREVKSMPLPRLALALLFTILNYAVLTGHDALAFRYLRLPLSYGKIALASFLSYAFSHNMGFALLSSASMRYRLYSTWGLSTGEILQVVTFNGITFWFGVLALGGWAFVWEPLTLPSSLHLPFTSLHPLGFVFLILVSAYVLFSAVRKTPLHVWGWQIPVPPFALALAQVALSALDWALAAGVLYVLLPSTDSLSYPLFLGVFVLAQIAGVSSQVPGGLGVVETVVFVFLTPFIPGPTILGALVAYRAIYYLLPLSIAVLLLTGHELGQRYAALAKLTSLLRRWAPVVMPQALALSTFLGGAMLLCSGATPALNSRLAWLHTLLPLPVIELSHFLASLVGLGLILLARGLQRRLNAAYYLTALLLSAGITFSLLKGFDYEEAFFLSGMLVALWAGKVRQVFVLSALAWRSILDGET